MDFETKRQKVLAYIKGLKTMPVVVTKGPAPEPVVVIDGVPYYHKQEFDLEALMLEEHGYYDLLNGISESYNQDKAQLVRNSAGGPPQEYVQLRLEAGGKTFILFCEDGTTISVNFTSRAFTVVDTQEEVTDNTKICLPTCSAFYGFLSEDGKTFISYYNLKDDGAPTETIIVPVYDQNGVDPAKIEALKAIAAGGKVGEELLDEIVDFIDNPPEPPLPDDKIHAYLTVPADSLTATFDCGTLIEGAEAKVDWGDGAVEDLTADTRMTHTYAAAGDYEVKISGMATFKTGYYPGNTKFFVEHLRDIVLSNLISEIARFAFANCIYLTSITIPNNVTTIDDYAFYGCTGLTSITIPDSVTSIGSYAFQSCSGLTSINVDPNNQTYYSEGNCLIRTNDNVLLLGCKTSVIPDSVTKIGENAFNGCTELTSITIPDSVTSIGDNAFANCTGLTSITIPDSVTSIGSYAFQSCYGLTSVTIGSGVTSIGDNAFTGCIGLTSITIPNGVTSIGNNAFANCTGLTSITIPDSVTSIGVLAFKGCTGLTSVTIGSGVTSIGESAFTNCSALAEVIFEDGREAVPTLEESSAFSGLSANYKIYVQRDLLSAWKAASVWSDISDHIEGLPWTDGRIHGVIKTTSSSQSVTFVPGSLIENVDHKIDWGDGTIEDLTAGSSITHTYTTTGEYDLTIKGTSTIADNAFKQCTSLTSITIPDSVTSIGSDAFIDCSGLTSVTIGSGVTSIGTSAFQNCTELTSITISNNVSIIGQTAFAGCTGLTSVNIGSGVNTIGQSSFWKCTGLTSIAIPKSVAHINKYAFEKCSSLAEVIFEDGREAIPSLSDANAFTENATGRKFYVQSDLLDAWKAATNWATYAADIEALPAA